MLPARRGALARLAASASACRSASRRASTRPIASQLAARARARARRGARARSSACARRAGCRCSPTCTSPTRRAPAAEVADVLQIPAFLCRQTDLLVAAGRTGKPVNVKKGQWMHAEAMARRGREGARAAGSGEVAVTERGTFFGYGDLVVDMRNFARLRAATRRAGDLRRDALRAAAGAGRGGRERRRARVHPARCSRAAAAAGADGFFLETHPDPARALERRRDAVAARPAGRAGASATLDLWHARARTSAHDRRRRSPGGSGCWRSTSTACSPTTGSTSAPSTGERVELKRFDIQDGLGLALLRTAGIAVVWVSGRLSEATALRATRARASTSAPGSAARASSQALGGAARRRGIDWEEVAFVGRRSRRPAGAAARRAADGGGERRRRGQAVAALRHPARRAATARCASSSRRCSRRGGVWERDARALRHGARWRP